MLRKTAALGFGVFLIITLILPCTSYAYGTLSWEASEGDVAGYRIYYGTTRGDYTASKDVGNVTEYSLTNLSLTEGATYYFAVRAYNATEESGNSNEISWTVSDTTPPMPPAGLTFNEDTATLQWNANTENDLKDYRVHYGTAARTYSSFVSAGKNTSISASSLETGKTYYFAISAVDNSGNESGFSSEVQGTISATSSTSSPAVSPEPEETTGSDQPPPALSYIKIEGPSEVDEKSVFDYNCRAYYSDGTNRLVEAANWSENSPYAAITSSGLMTLSGVSSTESCKITASYSDGGVIKGASYNIEIKNIDDSTIIIDNGDSGTQSAGKWTVSLGASPYSGDSLYSVEAGARYLFDSHSAGNYQVHLWWTSHPNRCANAKIEIYDGNDRLDQLDVNQKTNGGQWNIIGIYAFRDAAKVLITSSGAAGCSTGVDAAKFVKSEQQDKAPPEIMITDPSPGGSRYTTQDSKIDVSGTAFDSLGLREVRWSSSRGSSGKASGTGNWKVSGIELSSGENIITVTARDVAGNRAGQSIVVVYNADDATPPTIRRTKPTSWGYYFTRKTVIDISGTASDPSGVDKVEWKNVTTDTAGEADGKENWQVLGLKLQGGWNDIVITATDEKGNEAVDQLNVVCWSY